MVMLPTTELVALLVIHAEAPVAEAEAIYGLRLYLKEQAAP
jgi:hypothetical protein